MKCRLADAPALEAFGARLAICLAPAQIVYLEGNLGAGKTTLARGILRGLGYSGKVRSPTYTLVEPYPLQHLTVYHLDLYRLGDPDELEWLGLRDMLEEAGLLLVEWPERAAGILPAADLTLRLTPADGGRDLYLVAGSASGRQILDCLSPCD